MQVIFMGTPEFSVPVLKALLSEHEVVCVYTQPPRPSGRGQKLEKSAVHQEAEKHNIEVRCPVSLKNPEEQEAFKALGADVAVIFAYGLILPQPVLDACPKGCICVHPSLLPRWRGCAPGQRAIMAGDKKSGVTIIKMDAGLDTGDMLLSKSIDIPDDMNAGQLYEELSAIGAELTLKVLKEMPTPVPQPEEGVTYAHKILKEDCLLDWNKTAEELHNFIRGLSPFLKAYFNYKGEQIKVLSSSVVPYEGSVEKVGIVLDDQLTVCCGQNTALRLECLQRPGKKPVNREDFLRGYLIGKGESLNAAL